MKTALHDRINRVINTPAFESALEAEGICLFDFQAEWSDYGSFEKLPEAFRAAILAGEREMAEGPIALV